MHDDEILDYDFDVRVVESSFMNNVYDIRILNYILKQFWYVTNISFYKNNINQCKFFQHNI